ncbi:MAG: hydroxymethylbilane synthase [Trueperaceae bacterium]
MNLRIATRKSDLALWQANWVKGRLESFGHEISLVLIETQGDKDHQPFAKMQGQGFFTKAVQDAVLDKRADIAVHSHKDLPSMPMPGLEIAAVTERANPKDVLLIRPEMFDDSAQNLPLHEGAKVGTSAVRRHSQLVSLRPDLVVQELRGNVPTRVEKLRRSDDDAIVLAAAGLERLQLDLSDFKVIALEPTFFIPAPAQGVLAIECRREDFEIASGLTEINDMNTYRAISAERGLMAMLQGGCQLALGAYATFLNSIVKLHVWYEGQYVETEHKTSEGAALLAFEALGRPVGAK